MDQTLNKALQVLQKGPIQFVLAHSILVKWGLDLIKETEMVFGNFEGKDVLSGSFTAEHFDRLQNAVNLVYFVFKSNRSFARY